MFVPRPLASLRQKTLPHNNSRLRDSGEVGSRNSRLTVYPACPIDATRPSNDTFSACYRFFASWGGLKRHPSFPLQMRSEEHTSELQSRSDLVCRLLLEKKKVSDP